MKKRIIISGILCCLAFFTQAQRSNRSDTDSTFWRDKIFLGGNGSLNFGDPMYVNLSPIVGYRITEDWIAGGGLTYLYIRYKTPFYFEDTRWGWRALTRYYLFENLFAHLEYERLQTTYYNTRVVPNVLVEKWVPSLMIGGGYIQRFGRYGGITMSAMYILNHDAMTSPYGASPWVIRAGLIF